jgi:small-conductance mechanosensitive channel
MWVAARRGDSRMFRWFTALSWPLQLGVTLLALFAIVVARWVGVQIARGLSGGQKNSRALFWTTQLSGLIAFGGAIVMIVALWTHGGRRDALPLGLVSAGVAVALQKVWTAFAGYLVLLAGRVYTVGDRISIAGVRGDVVALGFLYTRVMEMGQPAPADKREVWVGARQFTGRIVTVTNDKIFEEPVYNYTRDFPFLFEELMVPIKYDADRARAEQILLRCAEEATRDLRELSQAAQRRLSEEYSLERDDLVPRVYYRLTDNWIELTVRFVVREHGIRILKDQMARAILKELEQAKIGVASATFELVGAPELRVDVRR